MSGYAVIDFETTGLFPGRGDRVIEIAVVHLNSAGALTGAWDTLVNPRRDLGPQQIHRIRAAEVMHAPTFAQIAPRLIELISERTIVAHNASFDMRFLVAELTRIGYISELERLGLSTDIADSALCTMRLAARFLPGAGRSLADCCAAYDIELDGAHRASVDALATAQLLEAYMLSAPTWEGWSEHRAVTREAAGDAAPVHRALSFPALPTPGAPWYPRAEADGRGDNNAHGGSNGHGADTHASVTSFLERITIKLPEFAGPAEQLDYLALLDRCLLDRQLSEHETTALIALAELAGISRSTCEMLHQRYFQELTAVAWADGELTTEEIVDLAAVATMLGISPEVVVRAMQDRAPLGVTVLDASTSSVSASFARFQLVPGALVVLTGAMNRSRDEWHRDLVSSGYVPWSAVTKKVSVLVAADTDSFSGKARKARDYGIPVVDEAWLARMLRH